MLPLLRFATGVLVGVIGVQLLKQAKAPEAVKSFAQKARSGLDKAGEELREATVSGLSAVEKSSAALRTKLSGESAAQEAGPAAADAAPAATATASPQPPDETATNEKA
ncbi:hypothetical protein DU475_21115 [Rhodopseudomonas sp. WA056]|uniref:Uncharacterized protein n=1 Tax=Rhodopseudomonas palustris (strain DX-1) TaxID=652103 RepID=E6VPD3_RHOPX|nr:MULTISPECIES: hypothetical protein [Rhodopseudomonas]NEW89749.1 hypothetical protein [Rhodopseudomonas sp. WA056]QDL97087.1 hypothetical protein FLL57_07100 [Rhodopseudomonas palustris]